MRIILLLALLAPFSMFSSGCSKGHQDIIIPEIKNLSATEVENILGKPDTSYVQHIVTKKIFTQIYKDDYGLEIMYPDGFATDIVAHSPKFPFEAGTLKCYGLAEIPPSHVLTNAYIKWKNYPGFKTINMFATKLDSTGRVKEFNIFFKSDGPKKEN